MHSIDEQLKVAEQNHLGHFLCLPSELGIKAQNINGVTVIHCGMNTSMFNIAYGSPKELACSIHEVKQAFQGQPFAWWIPPSQHHPNVTQALLAHGLRREAVEHAMLCALPHDIRVKNKTSMEVHRVNHHDALKAFLSVLAPYDSQAADFYTQMHSTPFQSNESLFVGCVDHHPVSIGVLFTSERSAGIFCVITQKDAQRKGYGTDMMMALMQTAQERGCDSVSLSASSDSGYRIYERLGFHKLGEFECFEYAGERSPLRHS